MKACVLTYAVLLAVALVSLPSASALKCYICNSVEDASGCGHGKDSVEEKYLKDCSEQPTEGGVVGAKYEFCRKIVTIIDFDVNTNKATERITRRCGYMNSTYDETCYYRAGFGGRQTVCSCKEDRCNSGFTFGVNWGVLGFAAAAAALMKYAY